MDSAELLSQVRIPNPCPVPWSDMTGDERVRFCSQCGRHVYHLAHMTAEDGARLLAARGDDLCVQIARRRDGTVVTADAPGPATPASRFARWLHVLAPIWAGILLLTGCQGRPPHERRPEGRQIHEILGGKTECPRPQSRDEPKIGAAPVSPAAP